MYSANLPGFTAEVALGQVHRSYLTHARPRQRSSLALPATCNFDCLENCENGCPDCWELPPGVKCGPVILNCLRQCRKECCH